MELGVVNAQIVMAGAKGILMFIDSTLLKENGGDDRHNQRMGTFSV